MADFATSFPGSRMIRHACALAGLLAVILQGSAGGHMLLVEHSRCAEHGELVHDGDAHHHADAGHGDAEQTSWHGTSSGDAEEAHGHCALSADRREALVDGAEPRVATKPELGQSAPSPADETFASEGTPLQVAPKTSPPA